MPTYQVNWNIPGYLPDSEPTYEGNSWEDARSALKELIDDWFKKAEDTYPVNDEEAQAKAEWLKDIDTLSQGATGDFTILPGAFNAFLCEMA